MENKLKAFIEDANGQFDDQMELKEYLIDEAEYDADYVESLSPLELVDTYLQYNGVCNFTEDILNLIKVAYNLGD
jgi:hypothetical protein|nr:MAG TPA: hypothetical protein [Caudoviricetes sp.]